MKYFTPIILFVDNELSETYHNSSKNQVFEYKKHTSTLFSRINKYINQAFKA
jgi:hypothetical protein